MLNYLMVKVDMAHCLLLLHLFNIFCVNKQENDSCNCPSCKKMQELQHPDLHFAFPMVQGISHVSNTHLEPWRESMKTLTLIYIPDTIDTKEQSQ